MKRKMAIILVLIIVMITFVLVSCGQKGIETKKIDNINIEIMDPDFLKDEGLIKWYEDSYRESFVHSVSHIDGYKYVLICAGEVPTAGYSIEITNVLGDEASLMFQAKLIIPDAKTMNAQVISYPHLLFRIREKEEIAVKAELDMGPLGMVDGNLADSYTGLEGVYIGLADNNFIEIAVNESGTFPGKGKRVVFILSEKIAPYFIKDNKEYMGLVEADKVVFDSKKSDQGQWEITAITKLSGNTQQSGIEGEYVGQIDANSVEIITNGTAGSYRLDNNTQELLEKYEIETGTKIRIEYLQAGDLRTLTKIEIISEP